MKIPSGQGIFPLGRWEVCRRGWHVQVPDRTKYQSKTKDESRFGHVSHLPIGVMGTFRSPRHVQPVVDRSIVRSCASENQARASAFSHRGDGKFSRSLRHVHTELIKASAAVVQARVEASASAIFPSGRWEVLSKSTHISSSCVAGDRARRHCDGAGRDIDTAPL